MLDRYTYKDELYKRLKMAFPRLNGFRIKRIAQDIIDNELNNPSILAHPNIQTIIVESWNCIYPKEWSIEFERNK